MDYFCLFEFLRCFIIKSPIELLPCGTNTNSIYTDLFATSRGALITLPFHQHGSIMVKMFGKLVWKLDLPERIKVFLWKCLKGILSVNSGLALHIHLISPLCLLCGNAEEAVEHLFCHSQSTSGPLGFGTVAISHPLC